MRTLDFTLGDLPGIAKQILLTAGNRRKFVLYGDMGAGKTTLISALCHELGVTDDVDSPTYALINEYHSPLGKVWHLDLYRLRNQQEALEIGIEDLLYDSAYVFIEWPRIIETILPKDTVYLTLKAIDDHRTLDIRFRACSDF